MEEVGISSTLFPWKRNGSSESSFPIPLDLDARRGDPSSAPVALEIDARRDDPFSTYGFFSKILIRNFEISYLSRKNLWTSLHTLEVHDQQLINDYDTGFLMHAMTLHTESNPHGLRP